MAETTPIKQARSNSRTCPEEFLVTNRDDIIRKLRRIAKSHCVITAVFNGGARSINTAIIDLVRDMELIALDICLNESTIQQILETDRVTFKTDVEGIDVQFTAKSIMKAKYQGQSVFAIPIPDRMRWVQHRDSYRICVPIGMPASINIDNKIGGNEKYRVLDISAGGLAIQDEHNRLNLDPGMLFDCHLYLPGHGDTKLTLEVLNRFQIKCGKRKAGQRVGCAYVNIYQSFGSTIQRYIYSLDIKRRRSLRPHLPKV